MSSRWDVVRRRVSVFTLPLATSVMASHACGHTTPAIDRPTRAPQVSDIHFNAPDWTLRPGPLNHMMWVTPDRDSVELQLLHAAPEPPIGPTLAAMRDAARATVLAAGGGLISADIVQACGGSAVLTVSKYPRVAPPRLDGFRFEARLALPRGRHG